MQDQGREHFSGPCAGRPVLWGDDNALYVTKSVFSYYGFTLARYRCESRVSSHRVPPAFCARRQYYNAEAHKTSNPNTRAGASQAR